ncbi:MAG: hypothetical protein AAGB46_16405 [Verrucomicrobiota bacterium]
MNATIRRLMAITALLSLAFSSGLHVIVLQGIAWTRMYAEYQKIMPAAQAVELTFSGRELCGICMTADEIQAEMEETIASYHSIPSFLLAPIPLSDSPINFPRPQRDERITERSTCPLFAKARPESPPPKLLVA